MHVPRNVWGNARFIEALNPNYSSSFILFSMSHIPHHVPIDAFKTWRVVIEEWLTTQASPASSVPARLEGL